MTTTTSPRTSRGVSSRPSPWATGLSVFAGVLITVIGVNQILLSIAALVDDEFWLTTPNYVYSFDLTVWGWVHLVFGMVLILTGFFVVKGAAWGSGSWRGT